MSPKSYLVFIFEESDKYKAIYCLFKALVGMQVNLIVVETLVPDQLAKKDWDSITKT